MPDNGPLLRVDGLRTYFFLDNGRVLKAVDGVSFQVDRGRTLGIVGESGSGKSVTARSILRIVERPGRIVAGKVMFDGTDLLSLSDMGPIRGKRISMVFQDPGTALDPLFRVGDQFLETIQVNLKLSANEARSRAIEAMAAVGVPDPPSALDQYPMDFSAGMIQRLMIGLAISCYPDLILADEPTTTLGVTIQAQILETLADIQQKFAMAIILITHDFGVISEMADDIYVMYAGTCMEFGTKAALLLRPRHPYTVGLINSVPSIEADRVDRLRTIPGFPPDMLNLPQGCPFAPRCERASTECLSAKPAMSEAEPGHWVACYHPVVD
jgi:oligopeptide/dipeptide ABC transporter ATP-binding protein